MIKFGIFLFLIAHAAWAQPRIINVYHWSGYLPESILKKFTEETGITVNSSSYDSNETLYTKIKAMPRHDYDLIMPSSYMTHRMIQEGMLQALDKQRLVFFSTLDPILLNQAYDLDNQYSLPYLFSATGLTLNARHHDICGMTHWQCLWQSCFSNQLLVLDDPRELFSIALLTLGFSPNTLQADEIQKAYEKLRHLLKNIRTFNSEGMTDLYATEELTVGMGFSGDSYRANQLNPNIQFVYPKEGYILSIDNLVIPKNARHIDEAYQLINFLLRPDIAGEISLVTGYGTTSIKAQERLPTAFLSNPVIYPTQKILKRGIVPLHVGTQSRLYDKYWEKLKIEG